ncbi:unnamed protein product [Prorocentrum cordatum]|uniref:Altered inheritance of mitochondria protein 24, mitochondrial n=1 Tax=Prorocentrum cordatum TaxID=2364126 RepID=A0ABN9QTW9_9DINO|nr:unnamed protein product [Polarella glacialis]
MARVLKLALTAFALQKACALDLAAETDLEEKDALGHRAYLDVTDGAVSAGAHGAEVQELSGHGHRAYLDVTAGAVSAGAHAAEVQELSGHGHRAYLDVTVGAVSAVASDSDMEELDAGGRPKGARRRAHERGLQAELLADVASTGCAQLGGKWFSDPHGNMFQVEQKGCMIDFMLTVAKSPKKHRKRGVIRGTTVLIEPPFPEGKVLMNQTVAFGQHGDWVRKW